MGTEAHWSASVSALDRGRYWRSWPAFVVVGSAAPLAAKHALAEIKRRAGKGVRLHEIKLHLTRLPTVAGGGG